MSSVEPFCLRFYQDNRESAGTDLITTTSNVPVGKRFVVEHISGYVVITPGHLVDDLVLWAKTKGFPDDQSLYPPLGFVGTPMNYGGKFGGGVSHHFGTPARMYVEAGDNIGIRADGQVVGLIEGCIIGYLVDQ